MLRTGLSIALAVAPACTAASDDASASDGAFGDEVFDPGLHSRVLALVDDEAREDLSESLEDAGGNWGELAAAVTALDGEGRAACVRLINDMPHLDRLEMTAATLIEHVEYAFRTRDEMPYEVPDEMFEPYILTYRVEEEPVDPWRRELYDAYAPVALAEGTVVAAARELNSLLARALDEREWEFFGPRQSPLLTLRSGAGTSAEISILACAMMKAVGIPSRQVAVRALRAETGGASWIEVFDGSDWLPLYPLEPNAFGDFGHMEREHTDNVTVAASRSAFERLLVTERYTETGTIEFTFVSGDEPAAGFEHFSVSVLDDGELVPLDALEAVADEDGRFTATLGEGRYVVLAGVRDTGGSPLVTMNELAVRPGASHVVAFDVTPPDAPAAYDREAALSLEEAVTAFVVVDPDNEPSVRMLPLIATVVGRRLPAARLLCAYRGETLPEDTLRDAIGGSTPAVALGADAEHFVTPEGWLMELPDDDSELPFIRVYAGETGSTLMEHEGYDLNIGRRVGAAIDAYLAELVND